MSLLYDYKKSYTRIYMNFKQAVLACGQSIWSLPFTTFIVVVGILISVTLGFVQFKYFGRGWKLIFSPPKKSSNKTDELSPIQAFINTLGASIGVGSIAGVATALCAGGPGAIFWMLIVGFIGMAIRFAEVYLSTAFIGKAQFRNATGGPMLYLSKLPAGPFFSLLYGFFCLVFALSAGNAIQSNSIALGAYETWAIAPWITGLCALLFIGYALFGGSARIITISDMLVPFKVFTFLGSAIIVLIYHFAAILPAIKLIVASAFSPGAVMGGVVGITLQTALRYGFSRGLFASEAGLGTAAVLFGATEGKDPVDDGILSMIGVFITTHIVCFAVALTILSSGVLGSGKDSTALTIAAYNTVFGHIGGWIVTSLAIAFGVSVMVTYAFIGKQCWEFLFGKKGFWLYAFIYAAATFTGAILDVQLVWGMVDIISAGMIAINLLGILWLLRIVRNGLIDYKNLTTK
jgi:alanine or glycine:cation symporter, AGCS family